MNLHLQVECIDKILSVLIKSYNNKHCHPLLSMYSVSELLHFVFTTSLLGK